MTEKKNKKKIPLNNVHRFSFLSEVGCPFFDLTVEKNLNCTISTPLILTLRYTLE